VRWRRTRPFAELVARQLDQFAEDHADELADRDMALQAFNQAPADEAEERYGDYVDHVDALRDDLERMRDAYSRTLEPETAEVYESEFNRSARGRFADLARELE
jgi:uncharacterized protein YukE